MPHNWLLARFRGRTADKFPPDSEIGKVRQRFAETVRVMIGFFVGVVLGAPAFRLFGFYSGSSASRR
jgi:hypothetical protein